MQSFQSGFPVFGYLLITWTVYPFMIVCCLPILTLPASLSYSIVCLPPALTLSTNSVYESVLPSLYLTPVTVLSCDSIKLHMDPDAAASSLQKISPEIDPAVFYHFTTEVSAQASMLATHQQQLN